MRPRPALTRGDVVLVPFPFADLSGAKLRPALIVGRVAGDDLLLAFITSRVPGTLPASACPIEQHDREFTQTGLKVGSVIQLDKLATLHRRTVFRRLGRIGPQTEGRVAAALRFVLEL